MMFSLVKGDVRRILKKISFYVLPLFLYLIFALIENQDTAGGQIALEETLVQYLGILFVSMPVFLSVYGDEMRTGSLQCVIGRGLPRHQAVLAKLLDCMILSGLLFAGLALVLYIKNLHSGILMTGRQHQMLFNYLLFSYVKMAGYFSISAFFVFLFWNVAMGQFVNIFLPLFAGMLLNMMQDRLHFGFYDYSLDGLLDSAYAAVSAREPGWKLFPAVLVYIVGFVLLSALAFRKKELEL